MTARRSVLIQILALGLAVLMASATLPLFAGSVVGPVGLAEHAFLIVPTLLVLLMLRGTVGVIRGRTSPSIGIYAGLAAAACLFSLEQGLVFGTGILGGIITFRLLVAMVFGIFVGLAPIVARVEQNPWFGVRTRWTLGSRRVWRQTHRATARLWLFGGVFGSALTVFGAPLALVFLWLVALLTLPIAISFEAWRKLGRD